MSLLLLALISSSVEIVEVTVTPNPLLVGETAKIECRVSEPERVKKVSLDLLDGLMVLELTARSEGAYVLVQELPVDAPTGTFPAKLVVELTDGGRVERPIQLTITESETMTVGTLKPTFVLDESGPFPIPRQHGIPFPSLERQSTRPALELSGYWYAKRVPQSDHDLSLTERTPDVVAALEAEMPLLFDSPDFRPAEAGWRWIRVPGPDNPPPDRYQGCVWYVTDFYVPADWDGEVLRLVFLAANYVTDVWLNGRWLGVHEGGYTPFVFEVTNAIRAGERHRLLVRVDNIPWLPRRGDGAPGWRNHRDIVPYVMADWWNYGGILRDVYLERLPLSHIVRLDARGELGPDAPRLIGSIVVRQPPRSLRLTLLDSEEDRLLERFVDRCASEAVLAETEVELTPLDGELGVGRFELPVPGAEAWTPEAPQLYYLRAEIPGGETFTTQVGFRQIATEDARLLWNDRPTFLRGASRHEDYATLGRGVSYAEMPLVARDLTLMKEMHSNFIRLGHYPNHPMTALLTDRIGLIAWEEIPVYWFSSTGFKNQQQRGIARQMWLEMIYTDFNRPSIGFWSTCNECSAIEERRDHIRTLYELAYQVDGSRLVVQSAAGSSVDPTHEETDAIGVTLYYGVFYGEDPYADTVAFLDKMHAAIPDKPILCSEFGRWAHPDWGGADTQVRIAEETFRALTSRDFVWGVTWWIGFDYQTFRTKTNTMGAITLDRHDRRPVYRRLQKLYGEQAGAN